MLEIQYSLSTCFTAVLLVLSIVLSYIMFRKRKGLPPGPPCLPLIGTLAHADVSNRNGEFDRLRARYGDVFTLMIGTKPVIVVNGYKALRELIVKHGESLSDRPSNLNAINNGYGIASSSGELWKIQRSFALKTLRSFGVGKRSLETQILGEIEVFLREVADRGTQPFDLKGLISIAVSNVICSIVFGRRFNHGDEKLEQVLKLVNQNFSNASRFRLVANTFPWIRFLPGDFTGIKRRLQNLKNITEFVNSQIQEHRETFDENNIRDYIDAFLLEQAANGDKVGSTFSDLQLANSIREFFIAGSETTATTLRWAYLFIGVYKNVQEKMRTEIDNVIGPNATPSMEHRSRLPYCEAVITEVQRLGNIAPFAVPHAAKDDVIWNGFVIPKGATLLLHLESVGFDPKQFPNPTKFDPSRFLDDNGKFIGQNKIVPFSIGRRVCLGESLARMELFLFIVSMVQRFELYPEIDDNEESLKPVRGATRSPKPYKIKVVQRTISSE